METELIMKGLVTLSLKAMRIAMTTAKTAITKMTIATSPRIAIMTLMAAMMMATLRMWRVVIIIRVLVYGMMVMDIDNRDIIDPMNDDNVGAGPGSRIRG